MQTVQQQFDDFQRGLATELAPNWRDLAAKDAKPIPELIRAEHSPNPGTDKIPPERYTSYEFHRKEVDKIWKRTWQVTCREEEIPNIGDHFVYNVAGLSFLIVRTERDSFKAFWNVCLHRCRRLVDHDGCKAEKFRCGYHAWTWNIDGSLAWYPGAWDFPDVDPDKYSLREVKLDTWGGFIFINPDANARPLAEQLGSLPKHFETWPLEQRHAIWHMQKKIDSNWKVAMEAFMEAYHVVQTHPQALPGVAEHATQYDIFDEEHAHFNRLITPSAIPSKHGNATAADAIATSWLLFAALREDQLSDLPPYIKDRASLAAWRREFLKELTKADYSSVPDVAMLDSIQYWLFPNFLPWFGEGLPLSYVFRPDSDSPDTCVFDIWMLVRNPDIGQPPAAPKTVRLGPQEHFEPHIGAMGKIFDQDDENMPFVQIGLKTWPGDPEGATLARYQESRIRHFHHVLVKALAQP